MAVRTKFLTSTSEEENLLGLLNRIDELDFETVQFLVKEWYPIQISVTSTECFSSMSSLKLEP